MKQKGFDVTLCYSNAVALFFTILVNLSVVGRLFCWFWGPIHNPLHPTCVLSHDFDFAWFGSSPVTDASTHQTKFDILSRPT